MSDFIKGLSFKAEFIIVISVAFGYFIVTSIIIFLNSFFSASGGAVRLTNESLISLIIHETIILAVILEFLKIRGNRIDLSSNTSLLKLIGAGLLLTVVYYLVYILLISLAAGILPSAFSAYSQTSDNDNINLFLIAGLSFINPLFEELLVTAYIITALSGRKGEGYAVNVSVLIRFLYHLYQGPIAAISIIPLGLIFAFVYLKWRNIWPLIIAHGIMNFISFSI